jgi:sugar-specific transcriptional regulator TrmB
VYEAPGVPGAEYLYYHYSLMVDFLDEKRREIEARLKELRPLVDEYNRLEKAAAALRGVSNGGTRAAARTPRRRGRGRPRGSGTRAKQALELVRARPGITISELAEAMGIHANYLYRVMPTLESEGQVQKRDRGWYPT